MNQRTGSGQRHLRRLLIRALLVAGCAVAGTATAWVLSTATASADTPDVDSLSAVIAGVVPTPAQIAVAPVVEPTAKAVADINQALRAEQEQARAATAPQLVDVAVGIRDEFGQVGTWFEPHWAEVLHPNALLVLGNSTNRAADNAPSPRGMPAVDNPATSFAELGEQWSQQPVQPLVALPDDLRPTLPSDPSSSPRSPLAPPVTVPVQCGCGGDGSGSTGSPNAAAQAAFGNAHNSAVARALKPPTERISVRPGKQPGSTPD